MTQGWSLTDDGRTYDITELDEEKDNDKVFYKERWIKENGLEQKLVVTYSIKYRDYQRNIRNSQIERAQKVIDSNPGKLKKCNPNDYKRFIKKAIVLVMEKLPNMKCIVSIPNSFQRKQL